MKVKDLIKQLQQRCDPDDQVFVNTGDLYQTFQSMERVHFDETNDVIVFVPRAMKGAPPRNVVLLKAGGYPRRVRWEDDTED